MTNEEIDPCPKCGKELCQCPGIDRGSFAKYVNEEWCPQHGYPLPCYKCGYDGSKFDSSKIGEPMPSKDIVKEHLIELFEQSGIKEPGKLADAVLWVENEDGVVRKVDRELPEMNSIYDTNPMHKPIYGTAIDDMLKAGYVAVEPLI